MLKDQITLEQIHLAERKNCKKKFDKVSGALLKKNQNGKIRYNHPQLSKTHKAPKNLWEQQIKKTKKINLNYENYKGRETQLKIIYILNKIVKKFVIKFHKEITQKYNKATALIARLKQKYIIKNV